MNAVNDDVLSSESILNDSPANSNVRQTSILKHPMLQLPSSSSAHQPSPDHVVSPTLCIALITETWPPEVNGVAHSVFQLAKGLKENGHHILLVRPNQKHRIERSPAEQEVLVRGYAIPRYKTLQFGSPAYLKLKQQFALHRPDIVHIVTEGPLGLAALYAAKKLGIPVSSGFHSPFHEFSTHFGLGLLLTPLISYLRFFHNRTKITCVPSEKTRGQLQEMGIHDLAIVSRGVDTEQFNPKHRDLNLRKAWGVGEQTTVLLYVGRLSPEKNIDLVIAAYRDLQVEQPLRAVQLVLVGDGPERTRLQKLAPDVIFAGMQTGEALSRHYASSDVFVFASQVETFGNVVPEAMASGLAVLAFNDAAAGQLVTSNQSGWLASPKQDKQFKRYAADLPKQIRLQMMGREACARVQAMGWQQAVTQLEQVFYQVAAVETKITTNLDVADQQTSDCHDSSPQSVQTTRIAQVDSKTTLSTEATAAHPTNKITEETLS